MIKLNIKQYIREHMEFEFNRRESPVLKQLQKVETELNKIRETLAAQAIGVQNVYNKFQLIVDAIPVIKEFNHLMN